MRCRDERLRACGPRSGLPAGARPARRASAQPPAVAARRRSASSVARRGRRPCPRGSSSSAGRGQRGGRAGRPRSALAADGCGRRVRRVCAAAARQEASERSSASADHQRTRCLAPRLPSAAVDPSRGRRRGRRRTAPGSPGRACRSVLGLRSAGNAVCSARLSWQSVVREVVADVAAAALHEVPGQPLAGPRRCSRSTSASSGSSRPSRLRKRVLLAAVRGRGDQDQVPVGVRGEALQQLVALVRGRPPVVVAATQVWASSTITSSGQARRKSSRRRSDLMKSVETMTCGCRSNSDSPRSRPRSSRRDGGRQHQLGVDVELVAQLAPATARPVRAGRARPGRLALALGEQLGGDQAGLDGLADADVVGDQQPDGVLPQRHQQRHELVGAGLDGDAGRASGTGRRWSGTRSAARRAAGRRAALSPRSAGVGRREGAPADLSRRRGRRRRSRRRCRRAGAARAGRARCSGSTTHSRPRAVTSEPAV